MPIEKRTKTQKQLIRRAVRDRTGFWVFAPNKPDPLATFDTHVWIPVKRTPGTPCCHGRFARTLPHAMPDPTLVVYVIVAIKIQCAEKIGVTGLNLPPNLTWQSVGDFQSNNFPTASISRTYKSDHDWWC